MEEQRTFAPLSKFHANSYALRYEERGVCVCVCVWMCVWGCVVGYVCSYVYIPKRDEEWGQIFSALIVFDSLPQQVLIPCDEVLKEITRQQQENMRLQPLKVWFVGIMFFFMICMNLILWLTSSLIRTKHSFSIARVKIRLQNTFTFAHKSNWTLSMWKSRDWATSYWRRRYFLFTLKDNFKDINYYMQLSRKNPSSAGLDISEKEKKSKNSVKFGFVEVREFKREGGGGGGVPHDGGPSLGLSWNLSKTEHTGSCSSSLLSPNIMLHFFISKTYTREKTTRSCGKKVRSRAASEYLPMTDGKCSHDRVNWTWFIWGFLTYSLSLSKNISRGLSYLPAEWHLRKLTYLSRPWAEQARPRLTQPNCPLPHATITHSLLIWHKSPSHIVGWCVLTSKYNVNKHLLFCRFARKRKNELSEGLSPCTRDLQCKSLLPHSSNLSNLYFSLHIFVCRQ